MGVCRGGNFLLGASLFSDKIIPLSQLWQIACLYIVYIGVITLISQEEVHAKHRYKLVIGGILYLGVIIIIVSLLAHPPFELLYALPFLIYFSYRLYTPLLKAFRYTTAKNISVCVKYGVLSVVIMDASLVAGSREILWGLLVLGLLLIAQIIARYFEVS